MTTLLRSDERTADQSVEDHAGLARSRDYCRDLTRRAARNFYFGLKLLPEPRRTAMCALYAYMRLVDDIADDDAQRRTVAQRRADLDRWSDQTHRAIATAHQPHAAVLPNDPVWPAFAEMVRQYQVPAAVFDDMVAGQRQDLEFAPLPDFAALREYCVRVASVVGVASLYVFGYEGGEETLGLGVERGIAFQLTNILRDLREDAERGRCYLPTDELARFGVTAESIARGDADVGFDELMACQVDRARDFYRRSEPLEQRVCPDARPTLAAMTAIYRGLLERIALRPRRVLRERVRLSTWTKLRIGWWAMRRGD